MSEREKILGRIHEALSVAAPVPGAQDHRAGHVTMQSRANISEWLPAVPESFDEMAGMFRANSLELQTDFHLLNSRKDFAAQLAAIRDAERWKKVASHGGELTDSVGAALGLPVCLTDGGYDVNELERCDAGITECDALIAQTGSVLVTSRSAGGRALSVLPPHHVVLARREQLLPDLPAAFALLKTKYQPNYPTFISLITGPSRTGDIERILVLGAHGPKKLTIFCA
jgi:L-lactate dehydrogenase complex protein LldG